MIVDGEPVARFVSDRLGHAFCPPYYALGIERGGEITGGVLINHFEGCDAHCSAAGIGWTKGFMRALGDYIFHQLGCLRFTVISEKPEVIALAERLGGEVEGKLRDHFGRGRHGVIVGVMAEDYRY